jgi:hypothetical protein
MMERIQIELHEDQDIEDKLQEVDLSVGTVLRTCVLIDEEVEASCATFHPSSMTLLGQNQTAHPPHHHPSHFHHGRSPSVLVVLDGCDGFFQHALGLHYFSKLTEDLLTTHFGLKLLITTSQSILLDVLQSHGII